MEHLNLDDLIWENEDDAVINANLNPMIKELCLLAGCTMVSSTTCSDQSPPLSSQIGC